MNRRVACLFACALMWLSPTVSAQSLEILCEDDPPAQFRTADGKLSGYTVELVQ